MSSYNSSVCIYPDGSTTGSNTDPPFVPCDPLAAESACCAIGESCIGNGLCYSSNGGTYRGACTDASWKSDACPKFCTAATGASAGTQNGFQFLLICGLSNITDDYLWSCWNDKPCASGNTFPLYGGGIRQLNISGLSRNASLQFNAIANAWEGTSDAASPVTSETSPVHTSAVITVRTTRTGSAATSATYTTFPQSHQDDTTIVGAAVGVALGVLFLVTLAGFIIYRKRWIRAREVQELHVQPVASPALVPGDLLPKSQMYTAAHQYRSELPEEYCIAELAD